MISIDNIIVLGTSLALISASWGVYQHKLTTLESRLDDELADIEARHQEFKKESELKHNNLLISQKETEEKLLQAISKMTESSHKIELSVALLTASFEHMSNNMKQSQFAKGYLEGKKE